MFVCCRGLKAEQYCSLLLTAASFSECRTMIPPDYYYRQCLYDICSSATHNVVTSCSAMAEYAQECHRYLNQTGIDLLDGWIDEVQTVDIAYCGMLLSTCLVVLSNLRRFGVSGSFTPKTCHPTFKIISPKLSRLKIGVKFHWNERSSGEIYRNHFSVASRDLGVR